MKEKVKKIIEVVLVFVIAGMSVVSAGGQQEKEDGKFTLGYNNFCSGVSALDYMEKNAKYGAEALGWEFFPVNDEGSIEKSVTNVQNMIASGVDAIMYFGVADSLFVSVSRLCEEAKIPLVPVSQMPNDKEVIQILQENPYFVGNLGDDNYNAGYQLGEYAAKHFKTAVTTGDEIGSPNQDLKIKGFTDAFSTAGGEVVGTWRGASANAPAMVSGTDDLLAAYPDVDCMYGAHGEIVGAYIENMAKYNNLDIKILVSDVDPSTLDYISAGTVNAANGGQQVDVIFAECLLNNWVNGNKLLDGNGKAPVVAAIPFCLVTSDMTELFQKFWLESVPISEERIESLISENITYDEFFSIVGEYTIENILIEKYKAGEVSKEKLNEVGINP